MHSSGGMSWQNKKCCLMGLYVGVLHRGEQEWKFICLSPPISRQYSQRLPGSVTLRAFLYFSEVFTFPTLIISHLFEFKLFSLNVNTVSYCCADLMVHCHWGHWYQELGQTSGTFSLLGGFHCVIASHLPCDAQDWDFPLSQVEAVDSPGFKRNKRKQQNLFSLVRRMYIKLNKWFIRLYIRKTFTHLIHFKHTFQSIFLIFYSKILLR